MSTSLKLTQTASIVTGGFRLVSTASDGSGIENQIFLYKDEDDSYQHVATVGDMVTYPNAKTPGHLYYRLATVSIDYTLVEDLNDELELQQVRTSNLVTDWAAYMSQSAFTIPTVNIYTA